MSISLKNHEDRITALEKSMLIEDITSEVIFTADGYNTTSLTSSFKMGDHVFLQIAGFPTTRHVSGSIIGYVSDRLKPQRQVIMTADVIITSTDLGMRGCSSYIIDTNGNISIGDFNSCTNYDGKETWMYGRLTTYKIQHK